MNILLVDDEKQFATAVAELLKMNKYNVTIAYNGEDGYDYALTGNFDLFILDVMMPGVDGFTLVKKIRNAKIDAPILMLTAKTETADKIQGLNLGADDYISKPFESGELLARIKALLRRKSSYTGNIIQFGDANLDRDEYVLFNGDKKVALGKKEFQILEMLMLAGGKNIEKNTLIDRIWGYDSEAEYNAIEVYVSFLRRKLSAVNCSVTIKSLRGIGYSLTKND